MIVRYVGTCARCGFQIESFEREPTPQAQGRFDVSANKDCSWCVKLAKRHVWEKMQKKKQGGANVTNVEFGDGPGLPPQRERS